MIKLKDGWFQYDSQIGTYRAEINGVLYGKFTNDISTIEELKARLPKDVADQITEEEVLEVRLQKGEISFDQLKTEMVGVKQRIEMRSALEGVK